MSIPPPQSVRVLIVLCTDMLNGTQRPAPVLMPQEKGMATEDEQ